MSQTDLFKKQLKLYKKIIDEDIAKYSRSTAESVRINFGASSAAAIAAYLEILKRGGKRLRGALVLVGYEMAGGKDEHMIIQAARALEMVHAYILIIDDIADRSKKRRDGLSAHEALKKHHLQKKLSGDSAHFGESIAAASALIGNHGAQMILSNLPVDPQLALKAVSITNRSMVVTGHGQINDIINEAKTNVSRPEIDKVLEWKTAVYSILNPLHLGMVLAGAGCEMTDAITGFAINTGKAFQITDDIIGTFSEQSGKDPADDIREGKKTLIVSFALDNCSAMDKKFLTNCLGNPKISKEEFNKCRQILIKTGARQYAEELAAKYIKAALESLDENAGMWPEKNVNFLRGLAQYLPVRKD